MGAVHPSTVRWGVVGALLLLLSSCADAAALSRSKSKEVDASPSDAIDGGTHSLRPADAIHQPPLRPGGDDPDNVPDIWGDGDPGVHGPSHPGGVAQLADEPEPEGPDRSFDDMEVPGRLDRPGDGIGIEHPDDDDAPGVRKPAVPPEHKGEPAADGKNKAAQPNDHEHDEDVDEEAAAAALRDLEPGRQPSQGADPFAPPGLTNGDFKIVPDNRSKTDLDVGLLDPTSTRASCRSCLIQGCWSRFVPKDPDSRQHCVKCRVIKSKCPAALVQQAKVLDEEAAARGVKLPVHPSNGNTDVAPELPSSIEALCAECSALGCHTGHPNGGGGGGGCKKCVPIKGKCNYDKAPKSRPASNGMDAGAMWSMRPHVTRPAVAAAHPTDGGKSGASYTASGGLIFGAAVGALFLIGLAGYVGKQQSSGAGYYQRDTPSRERAQEAREQLLSGGRTKKKKKKGHSSASGVNAIAAPLTKAVGSLGSLVWQSKHAHRDLEL